jgi:predicted alpha/beta hydrolase family esterase
MSFLILHGWQNHRPEGHWQRWLADRLGEHGRHVAYPQLPDPDEPQLDAWLAALERELEALPGPERVVVCHSLGCLLWLHGLDRKPRVDRVLLVAPPSAAGIAPYPEIAAFGPPPLQPDDFTVPTRIVVGDHDPYCPEGANSRYAEPLGLDIDVIPGGGHLDMPAGYGPWPAVLAWCLDPTTRVAGNA